MAARRVVLSGNRKLTISALGASTDRSIQPPFVTLLPAFNPAERQQAETIAKSLIDLGCGEFCCVAPEAEPLHDALDEIIEDTHALEVVTTWHTDPSDAFEYFLHGASGGRANLLALISSHPELQVMLEEGAR